MDDSASTRDPDDPIPEPINALLAYGSNRAGTVGEIEVSSRFAREGYDVAKPLWNDDEVDILVIKRNRKSLQAVTIPIQVKTVQFLEKTGNTRDIEGLRKSYVDDSPGLCLAVFRPEPEQLWLVPGQREIVALYNAQLSRRRAKNSYNNIKGPVIDGEERPERREVTLKMDEIPGSEWKPYAIDRDDHLKFRKLIAALVHEIDGQSELIRKMEAFWTINIKRSDPG